VKRTLKAFSRRHAAHQQRCRTPRPRTQPPATGASVRRRATAGRRRRRCRVAPRRGVRRLDVAEARWPPPLLSHRWEWGCRRIVSPAAKRARPALIAVAQKEGLFVVVFGEVAVDSRPADAEGRCECSTGWPAARAARAVVNWFGSSLRGRPGLALGLSGHLRVRRQQGASRRSARSRWLPAGRLSAGRCRGRPGRGACRPERRRAGDRPVGWDPPQC
jgi:hypothetical protein